MTVLVVGDDLDPERVIADLLALPGPIRVYVQDGPAEPTIASRVYHSETVAGIGPIQAERVVFADAPMVGSDQIALWPDLVLAYPSPPGKRTLTWAVVAHAVSLGRICAVWIPWLSEREAARRGAWDTIQAGLQGLGVTVERVTDRGGLRAFPFADAETESARIADTLGFMHALAACEPL